MKGICPRREGGKGKKKPCNNASTWCNMADFYLLLLYTFTYYFMSIDDLKTRDKSKSVIILLTKPKNMELVMNE